MSTTKQIQDRIYAALVHELKKVDATYEESILEKSFEKAFSVAIAPEFKLSEILTQNAAKQGCPLTADSEQDSSIGQLENWGSVKINRRPTKATGGEYTIEFTGTGTVAAGSQLIDQRTEGVYVLQADVVCVGTGTGTIKSATPGTDFALSVSDVLVLQQDFINIDDDATILTIVTDPTDAEDTELYRNDVVGSFRTTPRGGAIGDYVVWGEAVSGIYKIYPYSGGLIADIFIYAQTVKTDVDPIGAATAGQLALVRTAIEAAQPMTAGNLEIKAMLEYTYDVTITGLSVPAGESDVSYKTSAENTIKNYFKNKEPFRLGVDSDVERADYISVFELGSDVTDAISPATFTSIAMTRTISGTPTNINSEQLANGTQSTMNSLSWA